jgi:sugar O-acyltransferase (sialic acid O-acetyltransferase NeuD family)
MYFKHTQINNFPPKIILWGGTGQAKVVRPIIDYFGSEVIAVFDDTLNLTSPFNDVPIYHGWNGFLDWIKDKNRNEIGFCIAIGNPHGLVRLKLHTELIKEGLKPITLAHPSAIIEKNAVIGEGTQIMAGAIIQAEAKIGRQCIINTKASVDHECILSDGCEIAPGATLCGSIFLGTNVWIGAGATVLPRIKINENSIVGAGALVNKDIEENTTVVGVPVKVLLKK